MVEIELNRDELSCKVSLFKGQILVVKFNLGPTGSPPCTVNLRYKEPRYNGRKGKVGL